MYFYKYKVIEKIYSTVCTVQYECMSIVFYPSRPWFAKGPSDTLCLLVCHGHE